MYSDRGLGGETVLRPCRIGKQAVDKLRSYQQAGAGSAYRQASEQSLGLVINRSCVAYLPS